MSHHTESVADASSADTPGGPVPGWVDWLVGAAIALVGLLLAVVGGVLTASLDRATITDLVREGTVEGSLTEAELIDIAVPTVFWTGLGLLVGGLVLLVGAAAYVYYQRQFRQAAGTDRRVGNFWTNAVAGAVATLVFSFVPFSQVLGGAVAGYLEHGESGKSIQVGAVSGAVGVAPALVILPFVLVGIASGAAAIGESALTVFVAGIVVVALLFGTALSAGLGALGGYAGGHIAGD